MAAQTIDTGTAELLCHVEERVAFVTLNRPEALNALSMDLKKGLYRLLPILEEDDEVGALLLTGAGRAFCSGGDTKVMARDGNPPSMEDRQRQLRWEHEVPKKLHTMKKPVICALNGSAAGAGCSLALACDIRIAAQSAFILTSFARLGLSGDYGGTWFLTRLVGTAKAREIYFTARRVAAEECERLGIVNRVVPDEDLAKESSDLARQIAAGPPIALGWMKQNLNRALEEDLQTCMDFEADRMVRGAMTEDYREAVRAFGEKRPPRFKGQ
ncbi:MAG: enoyl-CoA hydratase [bacterium]|nr:enoyl-CoA hydratase [bacterium]